MRADKDQSASVYRDSFVNSVMERVLPIFHLNEQQAMVYVANGVSNLSRQLLHWVPAGLGSVASGFANFLIMAFILFFLFKNGSDHVASTGRDGRALFDRKDLDELIEKAKAPTEKPAPRRGRKPKRSK